jgi:hypothetical protein
MTRLRSGALTVMFNGKGRKVDFENVVERTEWEGLPQSGKPIERKLPHGVQICATGLLLPDKLDFDQWKAVGVKLCTIDRAMQWAIGDWWAFGFHSYGQRKAYAAIKEIPYSFGTLMNLGSVARSVKASFRNEALSFTHHVAVAALEPEDQQKWLTNAAKAKWSVSTLRQAINNSRERLAWEQKDRDDPDDIGSCAEKWASRLLQQAERACNWFAHPSQEFAYLDYLSDHCIAALIEASSRVADAWSEITEGLKSYRDKRAARANESLSPRRGSPQLNLSC